MTNVAVTVEHKKLVVLVGGAGECTEYNMATKFKINAYGSEWRNYYNNHCTALQEDSRPTWNLNQMGYRKW